MRFDPQVGRTWLISIKRNYAGLEQDKNVAGLVKALGAKGINNDVDCEQFRRRINMCQHEV